MLLIKRFSSSYRIYNIHKNSKPGDTLSVQGWIKNLRRLKNNIFLDLNDGSTEQKLQIVLQKNDYTQNISTGSSIFATGCIQVAPNGHYELHANDVKVIADGKITEGYPFVSKQNHSPEYVREQLHLRSRVDYFASMLRLRHRVQKVLHDEMDKAGFIFINTPIITTNDCEGAGEVFTVQPESEKLIKEMARPQLPPQDVYFDNKVFLSVSGQLHLEAMSYGLGNTYTFSPAFRAENCKSPIHLAEFYMFEAELAFIDDLNDLTKFIEKLIKDVTTTIYNVCAEDLSYCQKSAQGSIESHKWLKDNWITLNYDEALKIIETNKGKLKTEIKTDKGFSKEQELFLVKHFGAPIFVINWPTALKPFYSKVSRNNPTRTEALDLLMPTIGELCGGSLRENDLNYLQQHPQLPKGLDWYLDLRKFGGIPTGGFGMGFERFLQLLTGVKNIRDVIAFPRYPHNCKM